MLIFSFSEVQRAARRLATTNIITPLVWPCTSCVMAAYFLDTSVAGLILDGELLHRSPTKLVNYMPELSFACSSIEEIRAHPSVQRIKLAYNWSQGFKQSGGSPRLLKSSYFSTSSKLWLYYYCSLEVQNVQGS